MGTERVEKSTWRSFHYWTGRRASVGGFGVNSIAFRSSRDIPICLDRGGEFFVDHGPMGGR